MIKMAFRIYGITLINVLRANFKPSFFEITLKGLKILKVLKTLKLVRVL